MRKIFWTAVLPIFLLGCSQDETRRLAQEHANLASLAAEKGDFVEAVKELEIAQSSKPTVPEYMVGLGSVYARMGKDDLAAKEYVRALKIYEEKDNDPNAWNQRLLVLYLLNREKEMRTVLEEGRSKFPEDESLKIVTENYDIFEGFHEWKVKNDSL